jgi:hypothetical protein
MTPFEQFFENDFSRMLRTVEAPADVLTAGRIEEASWDRKAAYLLWMALGQPALQATKPPTASFDDLLG